MLEHRKVIVQITSEMLDISREEAKKIVADIVKRARVLSEAWVGTTTGSVIDRHIISVESLMCEDKTVLSLAFARDLQDICEQAERNLNGY